MNRNLHSFVIHKDQFNNFSQGKKVKEPESKGSFCIENCEEILKITCKLQFRHLKVFIDYSAHLIQNHGDSNVSHAKFMPHHKVPSICDQLFLHA